MRLCKKKGCNNQHASQIDSAYCPLSHPIKHRPVGGFILEGWAFLELSKQNKQCWMKRLEATSQWEQPCTILGERQGLQTAAVGNLPKLTFPAGMSTQPGEEAHLQINSLSYSSHDCGIVPDCSINQLPQSLLHSPSLYHQTEVLHITSRHFLHHTN